MLELTFFKLSDSLEGSQSKYNKARFQEMHAKVTIIQADAPIWEADVTRKITSTKFTKLYS